MNKYGEVLERVSLKEYNSYKIGGRAKYLIKVDSVASLINLIGYLKENNIKYFVLGNGTNVILPDIDFDGVIINLDKLDEIKFINENIVYVGAGNKLGLLVNKMLKEGYVNLDFLCGIPGSLGGAVVQNVGCYGDEIFNHIVDVTIYEDGKIKTLQKEEINYSYRFTEFKNKEVIVLGCSLLLKKGNVTLAKEKIIENNQKRKESQPLEYPNAGSVFKNPEYLPAGKLIEDAGLKGKTIGGAKVSEKHANFIINYQNATSNDIISLIDFVKKKVKEIYQIDLELEQIIVNW